MDPRVKPRVKPGGDDGGWDGELNRLLELITSAETAFPHRR
jgi:hypothetical protein